MTLKNTSDEAREVLSKILRDFQEFDTFCFDHFRTLHERFVKDQDRTARTTLLLQHAEPAELYRLLGKRFPDRMAKLAGKASQVVTDARTGLVFSDGAPIHYVDRDSQTRDLQELIGQRAHHVVLVPGPQGEAHELFLSRIAQVLLRNPPRRSRWIHFNRTDSPRILPFPTTQADVMNKLAAALDGQSAKELPARFAHHLQDQDLVLFHPVVNRDFSGADELLLHYYTRWLPDLLGKLQVPHCCMFIQPISWIASQGYWKRIIQRIFRRPTPRDEAYQFMYRVEAHAKQSTENGVTPRLPVRMLSDLEPISRTHVIDFLRRYNYAGHLGSEQERARERERFADKIMTEKATSEEILNQLSAELPDPVDGSPS